MATIGASNLTLADWAKRRDPRSGKTAKIVELLSQTNEILQDMIWMEGNLPVGHKMSVRTGLPNVFWRLFNAGVAPSKSETAEIIEQVGNLEAWSVVDQALALLNNDVKGTRLSEAMSFLEALNQEKADTLFYGNSSLDPEEFTGLSLRYDDLAAANAQNILDGGGTGSDNASMWLITWSPLTTFGIFPKGSKAGLEHEDFGLETVEVAGGVAGALMRAYRERWLWKCGIALRDWRFTARIANIDVSNLVSGVGAANLFRFMTQATHRMPSVRQIVGRPVWYCNRTVYEFLDIQSQENVSAGGGLTFKDVDGRPQATFRGIPVRVVDALRENEARVV